MLPSVVSVVVYVLLVTNGVVGISHSPIKVAALAGSTFDLNCTTPNGSWWNNGTKLLNNYTRRLENGVMQLSIKNITRDAQGVYWCGSAWQQGYNVSIIVGDQPGPPQNISTFIIDKTIFLQWGPSESTGGFLLVYQVWRQCQYVYNTLKFNNCTDDDNNPKRACNDIKYIPREQKYICELSMTVLQKYRVWVEAVNSVGAARSKGLTATAPVFPEQMYPGPPINLTVTEQRQGEIQLSWRLRTLWEPYDIRYEIVYNNQTWEGTIARLSARITHLKADTIYHFSVRAKICLVNSLDCSVLGRPASAVYRTKSAAPSQPPSNLNCSHWVTNGEEGRNVTITWEPPAKETHNGVLTNFTLSWFYTDQTSTKHTSTKHTISVNASMDQIVVVNARNDKEIAVELKACNAFGCSGISERCTTPRGADINAAPKSKVDTTLYIVVGVCAVVLLLACIVLVVYLCRQRNKKNTHRPLPEFDIEPYTEHYDDMIQGVKVNPYDSIEGTEEVDTNDKADA